MIDQVIQQGKEQLQGLTQAQADQYLGKKSQDGLKDKLGLRKKVGGKAQVKPRQLIKKDASGGTRGQVGAQDQQNDSMYVFRESDAESYGD